MPRHHTARHLVSDVLSNRNKFFDEKVMMLLSKTKRKSMPSRVLREVVTYLIVESSGWCQFHYLQRLSC